MAKQKQQTRKVFQAVRWTALGQYGTYNGGEKITTDRVPESTLKELADQGVVTYVGTEVWDEAANDWVAKDSTEQAAQDVADEPKADDKPATTASAAKADEGKADDKPEGDKKPSGGK